MEMCRICLTTEKGMIALEETFLENYNLLTNLNITLLDGMPQLTCRTCYDTVKCFIEFRERCIASETTLREIVLEDVKSENKVEDNVEIQILPTTIDKNINKIKVEVKEEDDDTHYLEADYDKTYLDDEEDLKDFMVTKDKKAKKKKTTKKRGLKKFKTEDTIKNIDNTETKLLCGICPKSFDGEIELTNHLDHHKSERRCGLCKDIANSWSQLLAHRLIHIPLTQHKCHICNKRFRACHYLEHHYRNHHFQAEGLHLVCKICLVTCSTARKMNCHLLQVHSSLKYFCDVCSKGFPNKSNLRSHLKKHSSKKTFVCDLCGFSCKHSGGFKDHHIRKHAPTKVYCKTCKRPFVNQESHDKHKCKNVDRICPICGVRVPGTSRLSRHMRLHSDVARYECPRCPVKYRSRTALSVHLDRHDGNKTKQCEFCSAKFYSASVLIKHRRTHTGEKPYVCKVCNKGFTGNNNLKVHMKVHGEYLIHKKNSDKDEINNVTV